MQNIVLPENEKAIWLTDTILLKKQIYDYWVKKISLQDRAMSILRGAQGDNSLINNEINKPIQFLT